MTGPFTAKEIHSKHDVRNAYADFWNNIKFKKGWEKPAFSLQEAEPLLDKAAEIVVRIRSDLDKKDGSLKIRMVLVDSGCNVLTQMQVDGNAREFLWTQDQDSLQDQERFIRDLVHETFKDANGYVGGLTEEIVDSYIKQFSHHNSKLETNLPLPLDVIEKIRTNWEDAQATMQQLLASELFQNSSLQIDSNQVKGLQSTLKWIEKLSVQTKELLHYKPEEPKDTSTESTPGRDLMVVEVPEDTPASDEQTKSENQLTEDKEPTNEPQVELVLEEENQAPPPTPVETTTTTTTTTTTSTPTTSMQEEGTEKSSVNSKEQQPEKEQEQQQPEQPQDKEQESTSPASEQQNTMVEELTEQTSGMTVEDQTKAPLEEVHPTKVEELFTSDEERLKSKPKDAALIKIQVVAEEVDNMKKDIQSLHEVADKWATVEDLSGVPNAKKTVETLQKKCLVYTEKLLKDLMALDEIVNPPEARPLRKQQVTAIQSMMEEVDNINGKLRGFLKHFSEKEEEQKREEEQRRQQEAKANAEASATQVTEEREEEEPEEQQEPSKRKESTRKQENKRKALEDSQHKEELGHMWKSMKLKPKMEVEEARDAYVVSSYIPGMNKDDLEIRLGNNKRTLIIAGLRLPTSQEEKQLKRFVANRIRQAPFIHPDEDKDTLLLKAGAGRYGRFEEAFELPPHVDVDNIEATYEGGVLRVVIPKLRQRPQPRYAAAPGYYNHPANFYKDRDFWW